jgi:predicted Fe-S protein YdhL (DUF1289 family)
MISPCIRKCGVVDGRCTGCGRTLAEISGWTHMSDAERDAVMRRLNRYAVPPINLFNARQFLNWVLMQELYSARAKREPNL